jgi:hypothetical protein
MPIRSFALAFIFCLSACKTGFNLEEEEALTEDDTVFHGPSNGAHWELRINDSDDDFTLRKFESASSSASQYRVSGEYNELSSGYFQLQITSGSTSDIDSNTLTGLRLQEDSIVLFPFADDEDELLALVPQLETCPSSGRGNTFMLERSPANSSDAFFIAELRYSFSNNEAQLTDGVSLPDLDTFDEDIRSSDDCENGYAVHSDGTNYLTSNAVVLEYANSGDDNAYERLLSVRRNSISEVSSMDSSDYVGFYRTLAEPDDRSLASADCDEGLCNVYLETDADDIQQNTVAFELRFEDGDLDINGLSGVASATVNAAGSSEQFNAICILNDDLLSSSSTTTKVMACHALDPNNSNSVMSVLLVSAS